MVHLGTQILMGRVPRILGKSPKSQCGKESWAGIRHSYKAKISTYRTGERGVFAESLQGKPILTQRFLQPHFLTPS